MFNNFNGPTHRNTTPTPGDSVTRMPNAPAPNVAVMPRRSQKDPELATRLELKQELHQTLLEQMNLSVIDKVKPAELRREVAVLVTGVLQDKGVPMSSADLDKLIDEVMDELLGLGPLEPLLADPSINDILVNSFDNIYVERDGLLEKTAVRFRDERHLMRIIDKIVSRIGRRVDESQPWVDARLEDGSRVNAIIRPCAIDGPSLSIRKFSKEALTMHRLVELGGLSDQAARILQAFVDARLNVLISGGTGSGKTTMLNAMSAYIDPRQRLVTIEDAAELQLQQDHVIRLETRPPNAEGEGAIVQRDLVRNALRMRPDRIIVGEVRGAEAFDMLQAMNTGHEGSMTTIHANTARDAVSRLEQMVTMVGANLPLSAVRKQIASGIHVIIQLNRMSDGKRRVTSISEITGMEGEVISMQDIFLFHKRGKSTSGAVLGEFGPTGVRPHCAPHLLAAGIDLGSEVFTRQGAEE